MLNTKSVVAVAAIALAIGFFTAESDSAVSLLVYGASLIGAATGLIYYFGFRRKGN